VTPHNADDRSTACVHGHRLHDHLLLPAGAVSQRASIGVTKVQASLLKSCSALSFPGSEINVGPPG
jgi:hypothetical protein